MQYDAFNLKHFSGLYNDLCDAIETINSTFTLQIIFVMANFLATDVFAAYGVLREFLSRSHRLAFMLTGNCSWMLIQYAIKVLTVQAGSSTTNEAEKTVVIVTKIAGNSNESFKAELNSFLLHMRCRNKKLENVFFTINWNLILAVGVCNFLMNVHSIYFVVSDNIYIGNLSHHHMSNWCDAEGWKCFPTSSIAIKIDNLK